MAKKPSLDLILHTSRGCWGEKVLCAQFFIYLSSFLRHPYSSNLDIIRWWQHVCLSPMSSFFLPLPFYFKAVILQCYYETSAHHQWSSSMYISKWVLNCAGGKKNPTEPRWRCHIFLYLSPYISGLQKWPHSILYVKLIKIKLSPAAKTAIRKKNHCCYIIKCS